jgi:hypothetical protein
MPHGNRPQVHTDRPADRAARYQPEVGAVKQMNIKRETGKVTRSQKDQLKALEIAEGSLEEVAERYE